MVIRPKHNLFECLGLINNVYHFSPPLIVDNTALKRKRNISGANSIPRKKSKVADSDLKHSTYDSAGVILKPHSQTTKEQPKKKQPTTEQKQKQKAAKV